MRHLILYVVFSCHDSVNDDTVPCHNTRHIVTASLIMMLLLLCAAPADHPRPRDVRAPRLWLRHIPNLCVSAGRHCPPQRHGSGRALPGTAAARVTIH
jgi:hypothetical protein